MLSLALVGFIWQLVLARLQGLINAILQASGSRTLTTDRLVRRPRRQPLGRARGLGLATRRLHHAALPGRLKGVDPSLREAAAVDGASEVKTFFRVIFPVLRPINVIVVVITVIESLRAFDLVWVINKGRNGLELISALVTRTSSVRRAGSASARPSPRS